MPSKNKTKNLKLNQWQENEYPKMVDFNDDNQAIDEAFGSIQKTIEQTDISNKKMEIEEVEDRELPTTKDTLKTVISKVVKYLKDLKTVAFTGKFDDLSDRPQNYPTTWAEVKEKPKKFDTEWSKITGIPNNLVKTEELNTALKDKLNKVKSLGDSDDLNKFYEEGFYSCRSSKSKPNNCSSYFSLVVCRADGTISSTEQSDSTQLIIDSNNKMFYRHSIDKNSGVWSDFVQVADADKIGNLSSLKTSSKSSLVSAINELFQSSANGKQSHISAIDKILGSKSGLTTTSSWNDIKYWWENKVALKPDLPIIDWTCLAEHKLFKCGIQILTLDLVKKLCKNLRLKAEIKRGSSNYGDFKFSDEVLLFSYNSTERNYYNFCIGNGGKRVRDFLDESVVVYTCKNIQFSQMGNIRHEGIGYFPRKKEDFKDKGSNYGDGVRYTIGDTYVNKTDWRRNIIPQDIVCIVVNPNRIELNFEITPYNGTVVHVHACDL